MDAFAPTIAAIPDEKESQGNVDDGTTSPRDNFSTVSSISNVSANLSVGAGAGGGTGATGATGTAQQPSNAAQNSNIASGLGSEDDANTIARLSSPWEYDETQPLCAECLTEFNHLNRRHHCRLCGKIFCGKCSSHRALLPPSSIVLVPRGGKQAKIPPPTAATASFQPEQDPDRLLTILKEDESQLLYGRGLEERFKLAREPLRVCDQCHLQVQPIQEELRNANSNAMRFNAIDPTDPRRMFNSPLAFTLGHEVRKAAYTLNNLLPQPRRMGAFVPSSAGTAFSPEAQQCKEQCTALSPNLGDKDGVHIPARLLQDAKGVAVLTTFKGGLGVGVEVGTGLVVARMGGDRWSAPCAIGTAGVSWGALIGAQVSDHVFLLMTDAAVEGLFGEQGNLQLGADIGVSVGPLGRSLEADMNLGKGGAAPIYTYSLSKGLYAGVSLDGRIMGVRHWVNEKFYGQEVNPRDILNGLIPTPPAAQPVYDALKRCDFYATNNNYANNNNNNNARNQNRKRGGGGQNYFLQQEQQQQLSQGTGTHNITGYNGSFYRQYNIPPSSSIDNNDGAILSPHGRGEDEQVHVILPPARADGHSSTLHSAVTGLPPPSNNDNNIINPMGSSGGGGGDGGGDVNSLTTTSVDGYGSHGVGSQSHDVYSTIGF